jgi:PiT family inorganic phosphate transporter
LGGIIAALFLAFIKLNIIYTDDKIASARRWVPILIAIMAGCFASYLTLKGLKRVWKADAQSIALIGFGVFALVWAITHPIIRRQSEGMENRNRSLRKLFQIPLICSAALLSFAHGANDVANAIGPLAAILSAVESGAVTAKAAVPIWVMIIGAFGISLGLFIYGPKLVRMVGAQITKMNPMRAYCVALSAAITVIVASWLGLPVSSTHIAVGAVFGVGFFREQFTKRSKRRQQMIQRRPSDASNDEERSVSIDVLRHRKLVRRSHFMTIIVAWVITVPASAILAAGAYYLISMI